MDSLTHIALGACIGDAFFGRVIGKKAMLWGALAQSVPDVDFISAFYMDPTRNLLAHRGFTHSFLFGLIVSLFLALVAEKWHRPHNISFRRWVVFFYTEIFIHLILDGLNNYGVGWLEPFSHARISLNVIYVADPFFSIWPGIACLLLFLLKEKHAFRRFWRVFGLLPAGLYLGFCIFNKVSMDRDAVTISHAQQIHTTRYLTTPTPLNNFLWYVVLADDSGYHIGYRSVFDTKLETTFNYFPKEEFLLDEVREQEDIKNLVRFSQGYYTVEKWGDTLVFNDLRFGQIIGWHAPKERFAFHYYITFPDQNDLVVQRGRFAKWDKASIQSMLRRMKGN